MERSTKKERRIKKGEEDSDHTLSGTNRAMDIDPKEQDDDQQQDSRKKQKLVEDFQSSYPQYRMEKSLRIADVKEIEMFNVPSEDDQQKDSRKKQKLVDDFQSPYPQFRMERPLRIAGVEEIKMFNVPPEIRGRFEVREREEYTEESSKRARTRSPEVIRLRADSSSEAFSMEAVKLEEKMAEPLKLMEEIVSVYSKYIDHILLMARNRFKDEDKWNFGRNECGGLAEIFLKNIQTLGSELVRMKNDLSQMKNYFIIAPRIRQIMNQLETMHESFDRSPNISASAKPNCTKQELIACMEELNQFKKQLYEISSGVCGLKTMNMYNK